MKLNRGWKEAFQAIGFAILVGAAIAGTRVLAVPLRFREEHCSRYCPELEAGLSWEITGRPTFGRDPVGTIRLRQPIFVKE